MTAKCNLGRGMSAVSLIKESSGKILEIGIGDGEFISNIKEKSFDIIGLDVFPNENLLKKGFDIRKCDLNKGIPFKRNSFDILIGLEILEHLYNPYEMMKEIKRVLKPNGYTIISMPNSASIFQRIGQLYEKRYDNLNIYWHHYQPCLTSIRNLISKEFEIEEEVFISSFRKLSFLNPLLKVLVKLNADVFCGNIIIKARKTEDY